MQHPIVKLPFMSLFLLSTLASFIAVVITPAIPALAEYFHIGHVQAELSVSLYLLGYGIGQLIYGSTANYLGRKKSVYIGMVITFFSVLVSLFAAYFQLANLFLLSRFLTALGASAGLVIGMIMISDTQEEHQARKTFSAIVLAFAIMPFIAIYAGGFLTDHFGWITILYVELAYTLLILVVLPTLPETLPRTKQPTLSVQSLIHGYLDVFKNTLYLKYVLLFTIGGALTYVFNALAPVLAHTLLHVSAQQYGSMSIFASIGILVGGFISNRYAKKTSTEQMIFYGTVIIGLASVVLLLLFITSLLSLLNLFITAAVLFIGIGLIVPNASMKAVAISANRATATAIMNAGSICLTGLMVSLAGSLITLSELAFPLVFLGISILSFTLLWSVIGHQIQVIQE